MIIFIFFWNVPKSTVVGIGLRLETHTFTQTFEHCFYLLLYKLYRFQFQMAAVFDLGLLHQFLFFFLCVLYCDVSSFVVMETGVLFPFSSALKLQIILKRNPVLSSFKYVSVFAFTFTTTKLHFVLLCWMLNEVKFLSFFLEKFNCLSEWLKYKWNFMVHSSGTMVFNVRM